MLYIATIFVVVLGDPMGGGKKELVLGDPMGGRQETTSPR